MRSKGYGLPEEIRQFPALRDLIEEIMAENACLTIKDLAIDGNDLRALGIPAGPEMGKCLARLLQMVQDEAIPNEKEALLKAAK